MDYHELGEAGIVINVIGACLICLAILMPYIIRNLDIKRLPNPMQLHKIARARAQPKTTSTTKLQSQMDERLRM